MVLMLGTPFEVQHAVKVIVGLATSRNRAVDEASRKQQLMLHCDTSNNAMPHPKWLESTFRHRLRGHERSALTNHLGLCTVRGLIRSMRVH